MRGVTIYVLKEGSRNVGYVTSVRVALWWNRPDLDRTYFWLDPKRWTDEESIMIMNSLSKKEDP